MARWIFTERHWLELPDREVPATERAVLVEFLQQQGSLRKLRLFACACLRRELDRFPHLEYIVAVAERYAEGPGHRQDLESVRRAAYDALADCEIENDFQHGGDPPDTPILRAHRGLCGLTHDDIALSIPDLLRDPFAFRPFLYEIFGNPFRPVKVDPAWLEWNRGLITQMVAEILETARYEDCPILADALEEAGCEEASLLEHLRGRNPHVCGCWALDLLSGRT